MSKDVKDKSIFSGDIDLRAALTIEVASLLGHLRVQQLSHLKAFK
jgi:hypothetical protein